MKTIGFIGCGKMAQAMIGGMVKGEKIDRNHIIASSATEATLTKVKETYQIQTTLENETVAKRADVLILAVAPHVHQQIISEIKTVMREETIVVTIAAGISTEDVEVAFASNVKVVRTMPNTPSLVQAGMSAMCANSNVTEAELNFIKRLFETFGSVEVIDESQMDAIPSISGSSPAYAYMLIEAMGDSGVRQGLSREQSYHLASQAILGAAKMVLETGIHPAALKDQVCSPGGATIAAVSELEKKQFRGSIQSGMDKCTERVLQLSKKK